MLNVGIYNGYSVVFDFQEIRTQQNKKKTLFGDYNVPLLKPIVHRALTSNKD